MVDDVNEFYMEIPVENDTMTDVKTDYSNMVKAGEGRGEFNGRTLPYEEYAEKDTGIPIRFYLDGGSLCGIEINAEGTKLLMIIENIKNSVPAGTFDLPAGYMDMGDLAGMLDGFDLS